MNASSYIYEALRKFVSSMRAGWRNYILGLTYARQKEVIYQPVWAAVTSTATALTHREFWETLGARLAQAVSPTYWGLANGGWFSSRSIGDDCDHAIFRRRVLCRPIDRATHLALDVGQCGGGCRRQQ